MNKLHQAKASVWDMDGCLYPYHPDMENHCDENVIATLRILGAVIEADQLSSMLALSKQSYAETGHSLIYPAQKFGFDLMECYRIFHDLTDMDYVAADDGALSLAFTDAHNRGHKVHLATHSHHVMVAKVLQKIRLDTLFNANANILTLEEVGFDNRKCQSAEMVLKSAKRMGIAPSETVFVEDTAKNFIKAKDHGFITVLVDWNNVVVMKPTHVDFVFPNPIAVVRQLGRKIV